MCASIVERGGVQRARLQTGAFSVNQWVRDTSGRGAKARGQTQEAQRRAGPMLSV